MTLIYNDNVIATDKEGYLTNLDDWTEDLALIIATNDNIDCLLYTSPSPRD